MGGGDKYPNKHELQVHRLQVPATAICTQHDMTLPPAKIDPIALRIITHNIRYAATNLFRHERPWSERLPNILRQFRHYAAGPFNPPSTIICLQEVLLCQLNDLAVAFGDVWTHVGIGRDDGKAAGEFNPIFYQPEYWARAHLETVWLSETPEQPGLGWDAGSNRICTCLVLRSRFAARANRTVMILNTHLDNAGPIARRHGAELIVEYARSWQKKFSVDHMLLMGDLNSTRDEKHGAWKVLNSVGSSFVDVDRLLTPCDVRRFGDKITFTGFDGNGDDDPPGTLDFVHYGLNEKETLLEASHKLESYTVVPNLFDDDVRCSDHRAVVVDLML